MLGLASFCVLATWGTCFVQYRPRLGRLSHGMPSLRALEFAKSLANTGPRAGSRELLEEFKRSYRENPYPEKLSLFFPDPERILSLLYNSGSGNYTSSDFLKKVAQLDQNSGFCNQ